MIFKSGIEDKVASKIATKVLSDFSMRRPKKKPKTSLIKDIINNSDDYELLARKEDEEFVVRIRKNTFKKGESDG